MAATPCLGAYLFFTVWKAERTAWDVEPAMRRGHSLALLSTMAILYALAHVLTEYLAFGMMLAVEAPFSTVGIFQSVIDIFMELGFAFLLVIVVPFCFGPVFLREILQFKTSLGYRPAPTPNFERWIPEKLDTVTSWLAARVRRIALRNVCRWAAFFLLFEAFGKPLSFAMPVAMSDSRPSIAEVVLGFALSGIAIPLAIVLFAYCSRISPGNTFFGEPSQRRYSRAVACKTFTIYACIHLAFEGLDRTLFTRVYIPDWAEGFDSSSATYIPPLFLALTANTLVLIVFATIAVRELRALKTLVNERQDPDIPTLPVSA